MKLTEKQILLKFFQYLGMLTFFIFLLIGTFGGYVHVKINFDEFIESIRTLL
jgi:hypothetical protein